jgi:superfamily II DNA or RNA helicase
VTAALDILAPRPYQDECLTALGAAYGRGVRRAAAVLATGLGKTVIFAHLAARWTASIDAPGRVVILVHRDELVRQAVGKLHTVAPHLEVGVIKAGENDVHADVIVASVQTLRSPKRQRQLLDAGPVGLVIVDECHHSVAPTYLAVLTALGVMAGRTLAAGFTATMDREDNKALGHVWQEIVYERDILWGIQNGFLVDVKGIGVTVDDFDMRQVRTTAGDYSEHDLGEALADSHAPEIIAKAYAEHAPDQPGLVFAPTVATSQLLADTLTDHGIETRHVDGTTPADERRAAVDDLTAGKVQALSNCALFTEGTDIPVASVCVVARPTKSNALYVQMVGRVLRPDAASGKRHALVLDIVGAASRNSLVGLTRLTGRQVYDTESLLEADVRLTEEELAALAELEVETAGGHAPDVMVEIHASETRELDLFHGSRQQWLTSPDGWPFLPSGEWLVAILPSPTEPGRWDVGAFSTGPKPRGQYVMRGLDDIGYALAQAERSAAMVADLTATRWRTRRTRVGERRYAETLGVQAGDLKRGQSAGELADLIAVEHARRTIDPGVRAMMAGT